MRAPGVPQRRHGLAALGPGGSHPIPCKFVITSKATTSAPQYTLLITDWKSDATIPSDAFTYKPADGAKKVEFDGLSAIDEVPPGVIKGGKQ
jgi:hypothetical protein